MGDWKDADRANREFWRERDRQYAALESGEEIEKTCGPWFESRYAGVYFRYRLTNGTGEASMNVGFVLECADPATAEIVKRHLAVMLAHVVDALGYDVVNADERRRRIPYFTEGE